MMQAFHSTWTKPFFKSHEGDFYVEDFELLTTILSALKWREFNGSIKMITDKAGAIYYRKWGLEDLWDLGIDDTLEEEMDSSIDESVFWAAGKLYALEKQDTPCVMMDTDFIVWENIKAHLMKDGVTLIHREKIQDNVYPEQSAFLMKDGYRFSPHWNWEIEPCNTAFLCMRDESFKRYYIQEAKAFMKGALGRDPLIYMVFAEQRLLAMCAEEKKIDLYALSSLEELFHHTQKRFTHIWGHKRLLRNSEKEREKFCKRCIERIERDYPDFYPKLKEIESLQKYMRD